MIKLPLLDGKKETNKQLVNKEIEPSKSTQTYRYVSLVSPYISAKRN